MGRVVGLALILIAACGGKKSPTTPDGAGAGTGTGGEVIAAQTLLSWGLQGYNPEASNPVTKIFLEVTDHNGATKSYPVGEARGACTPAAGNGADIITALACIQVVPGVELRAVFRGQDIIVLSRRVDEASEPADELAFQEVTRVPVPAGASVKPAP
ncbi:MAG TPA: hypothetical protein VM734_24175 [Kofleriaceae bacterium]|jgi:hypothetical protein|nr:hypothetical protein [Kofleriaceae bacterium]